ncbi:MULTISPECIES: hydroxymethylglutaryl-CoA lyase [unclassified Pseudovibrio]|uniref:hydroxymethylglutaryl-CoA lyase n=1 Tax=unclassified Pseudovibrio TaxID=2627060 RepID=UPI0007AEB9AC|nr:MULTISPECIES: hydroxymethylglutaryl-CoA lyase [unclassified Pseudovibrio]KZK98188.1 Hydroxymethylglutaryl-CoA lyase YngG [Pseudovibrio sp. W74]KZL04142.1 Hydroxymethylglutaryl-CoA lyase YngG [Pseudovibrio sp. Ad14]KZL12966.1 Hydroxymethylglutaryl-CoA lyase YngG [Pseudovibrio sp. Ad37]
MSKKLNIFEMGPRDGLQNEKTLIPTANKIELINLLSECGFEKIETSSFVSPKWVPQMADAAEVFAGITRKPGVRYTALTPNIKGYERAKASGADEVAIFASASEGFSQKNINCSIEESFERFTPIVEAAKADGIPVRGYVSCIVECPYDGPTPAQNVAMVSERLLQMGCYEVSLGDTIGAATPETTEAMLDAVLSVIPAEQLAGHFHDTKDLALANIMSSIKMGLRTFDSAIGGLGGCPYAPGAKGNVSTLAVAKMAKLLDYDTGLDIEKLAQTQEFILSIKEAAAA